MALYASRGGNFTVNAWTAIPYVGTGLSLVAFLAAVVLFAFRAKLKQRAEIIKSASAKDRVEAINATAEVFRVDLTSLNAKQKQEIILAQIKVRAHRDLMVGGLA